MDIILSSTLYYTYIVLNSKVDFFQEIEYDTYPPPDQDFVYEDPYVTEEELRLISSTNPQQSLKFWPRKPASGYFYFAKQHRARLQEEHPT